MIVTAIERRPRRRRVNVFVDGRFALEISLDLAVERDLRPGHAVTAAEIAALADADAHRVALDSALRLLSYRPRSERELRDRLQRKGVGRVAIDDTIRRLRELGYVDDAAFARFWTETRQAARPRARRILAGELRRQGVAQEEAEEATAGISDEEAARAAAGRRLRHLEGMEYQEFRERLGRFLTSRGFTYDVARRTIDQCWAERAPAAADGPSERRSEGQEPL